MKKTVIGLMLCGAAALASCNLDTIPTDKYTVETFWETEEGTEAAMTGCYNILTNVRCSETRRRARRDLHAQRL